MVIKEWIDRAKDTLNNKSANDNKLSISGENKDISKPEDIRKGLYFQPDADICTCDENLVMEVDMPGVEKDNLKIDYENEILSIEANIDLKEYEGLSPIYTEYKVGNYIRKFRIGEGYNIDEINASFKDGVLNMTLPKREHLKSKSIAIK